MARWSLPVVLIILLVMAAPALAQGGEEEEVCPLLVQDALLALETNCDDLGRDTACYGYPRVDATFWLPNEDLRFSQPADRVDVIDLQSIATAPMDTTAEEWGVALLSLRADVPDSLPGQAVTFLVMGDATLENAVAPEDAAPPVTPVDAVTLSPSNLRSAPTTSANVVTSVGGGETLRLVGVNEDRTWYQAHLPETTGRAWIFGSLVEVADFDLMMGLPVVDPDTPRYGPMQAFYFTTGLAADAVCAEAPSAIVVQNNELTAVTLTVNELEIRLGSTAVLTTAPVPGTSQQAMVISLVEGGVWANVNGDEIRLNESGEAMAVTLNNQGVVDGRSRLVNVGGAGGMTWNACSAALAAGAFGSTFTAADCADTLSFATPPPPPTPIPFTPTPVPTPTPTPVPGPVVNFTVDRDTINFGECVNLAWDVQNVQAVYYQGQGVTGQGGRQECPPVNTTYVLRVVANDGQAVDYTITVTVVGGYSISFVADRYQINVEMEECATLSWSVSGVQEVYFEGEGVTGQGGRVVCPYETTTYTLMVITTTGQQVARTVTIETVYE